MLRVHPWIRAFGAVTLVAAVFLTGALSEVLCIYLVALGGAYASGVLGQHVQLLLKVSLPLLAALLLVWVIVLPAAHVPLRGMSGSEYALFIWARLLCCGAVLQVALLPLFRSPLHLRAFLGACRIPNWFAVIVIGAIVFLPEIGRRFRQLVDARQAQGLSLRGVSGLREIPSLIMPLVSSLLEAALARAEFWSHRGVLEASVERTHGYPPSVSQSLVCALVAGICLIAVVVSRSGASWA